jgi:heme O synthase-like polyprenyltransferase
MPKCGGLPGVHWLRPAQSFRCAAIRNRVALLGSVYLAVAVNVLASVLAFATLLAYLLVYTPLKRKTPLCTLVGAFPGAMPPLIGWAGACGRLPFEARVLYAVLFLWQFPHFMAIAWMYREDYARAGYLVLPSDSYARSRLVNLQTALSLLALLALSLLPGGWVKRNSMWAEPRSWIWDFSILQYSSYFADRTPPLDAFWRHPSYTFHRYLW